MLQNPTLPSPAREPVSKHTYKPQSHQDTKKKDLKIDYFVTLCVLYKSFIKGYNLEENDLLQTKHFGMTFR